MGNNEGKQRTRRTVWVEKRGRKKATKKAAIEQDVRKTWESVRAYN